MSFKPGFIYTDRHFQTWPSWQIVFEWEDALSEALSLPLKNSPTQGMAEHKLRGWDNRSQQGKWGKAFHSMRFWKTAWESEKREALYFEMAPRKYPAFSNSQRVAPVLIDVFPDSNLEDTLKYYKRCPRVYFTSLEILHHVKQKIGDGPWFHLPMSLPDKYRLLPDTSLEKKIPIVLSGRTNEVLLQYLKQYEQENPGIEYLQQKHVNGKLYYVSNLAGVVGEFSSRSAYWQLIKSAQVCFYSTPGMDEGAARTGGFNPLTPRWFELLAAGCHVIARFPDTPETRHYRMSTMAEGINNYEQFKLELTRCLSAAPPIERNAQYLQDFYTSKVIPYLQLKS